MRLTRRKRTSSIPPREKSELQVVKRRLQRVETRVNALELEVKLYRRDT